MLHSVKMQDVVDNCKHKGTCIKKFEEQKHNKIIPTNMKHEQN